VARHSLRRRLVGLLLLVVAIGWAVVSTLTYQDARREIDAVLDAHLEQAAVLLAVQADHELFEIGTEGLDALRPYGTPVAFQVWDSGGRLLLRSTNAPASRLSAQDAGFSDAVSGAQRWRVYGRWGAGGAVLVQIAESRDGRERFARHFVLHALWPLVVGLPLLGLLVWVAVSRALRPLAELRLEVSRRRATDLGRLTTSAVPIEVAPLVEHLNALFERIRGTLESERRFTSHAAHELRTPIAAIRAQAESATEAQDAQDRQRALGQVVTACDRLSRVVTQLLTLARVDEEPQPAAATDCRLDEVAARVVAELAPGALDRGVEIELDSAGEARIAADPVLVEILVRNLIDNAVAYAGRGSHVAVSIVRDPSGVVLAVTDDGPALSEEDIVQLGRPFFRGARALAPGTGLGLSIVGRIAERSRAEVRYGRGEQGRGLRVEVSFPS
jgi:two-component system, OmpR family, sensor histidine kinase QseC